MKYCNIEKGADYNVYCYNTGQPTIDHCELSHSAGNGLKLSNSSLNIRNSSFTFNLANGIYLEGNSNPTIGNDTAYTCNLFNNGAFNIYNNTVNNINARFNYWSSCDSIMITQDIFDKYDSGRLGRMNFVPFACVPALLTDSISLNGSVKYKQPVQSDEECIYHYKKLCR